MKWTDDQTAELKDLCFAGKTNKEIANDLGCRIEDVYAKRSQMGITIDKCRKAATPNPEFKQAIESMTEPTPAHTPLGMVKEVREAFKQLNDALLLAMASDWTSQNDARVYGSLARTISDIEDTYNFILTGE